ncbi:MAG: hypothetical protein LBU89_07245 [Fibromonadaceae bacterium]|jgi:hypothetical protein|nr:hypothetical protein [Fibromonadaceae bacterium]
MAENLENLTSIRKDSVKLSDVKVSKSDITFKYHTLNGRKPKACKDYVGIWNSSGGMIPVNQKSRDSDEIKNDDSSGTWTIVDANISSDEYILGYCLTGNPAENEKAYKNVSASAIIPREDGLVGNVINCMDLHIEGNSSSATLTYTILAGMERNEHWLGIWRNGPFINPSDKAEFVQKITDGDSKNVGRIVFNNIGLRRNNIYTLAYFANGWDNKDISNMVAYIHFQI